MLIRITGEDHGLSQTEEHSGMKQIQSSIDRFVGHIKDASLRLTHTKETHGENNKSCQAIIHLNGGDEIIIEKKHNHFSGAMALVSKSLKNAMSKAVNTKAQDTKHRRALKFQFEKPEIELPED